MTAEREEAQGGPDRSMTRDEWLAYLLDQAPDITVEQWEETVAALVALRPLGRGEGRRRGSHKRGSRPPT